MFLRPPRPAHSAIALLLAISAFVLVDLIRFDQVDDVFQEGRSIEAMSAVLFFAGAAIWFVLGLHRRYPNDWHLPVILALMGMRELDFDKRFTSEGVMQLRLYTSSAPPLWEKIVGALVLALILWCGLRLLFQNVPGWWRRLRDGWAEPWLIGGAAVLLVVSKTLDGLGRKLAPFGVEIGPELGMRLARVEETMELVVAVLIVQAMVCLAHRLSVQEGRIARSAHGSKIARVA